MISKTIQIDDDGNRLTAHFVKADDGTWELRDLGSNVDRLPRDVIRQLLVAVLEDERCMPRQVFAVRKF